MSMRCSWCSAEIPEELRFSDAEREKIKEEEKSLRAERNEKEREANEKRQKGSKIRSALDIASIFTPMPSTRITDDET